MDGLKLIEEYLKDQGFRVDHLVFHLEVFIPSGIPRVAPQYVGYVQLGLKTETIAVAYNHRKKDIYQIRHFDLYDPNSLPDLVKFLSMTFSSSVPVVDKVWTA